MDTQGEQNGIVLRISDLAVRYGTKEILTSASLDLRAGEIVTLLGRNGCGKSTFLRSIAGVVPSCGGTIILNSVDVTKDSPQKRMSYGLGLLVQGQAVFPSLSVNENLQVASRSDGRRRRETRSSVWESFPSLRSLANRRVGLLSGGERQMLGLAMVFTRGAKLWLLDEPSAGLDADNVLKIMELVRDINRVHGITILMVEQNYRAAVRVASRVCYIRNRSIITAKPEDMRETDWMSNVYATEVLQ